MAEVDQNMPSSESPMETNQDADLTMQPPVRKNLKPEVQRKLIKRAVLDIVPQNPIGALYALFEKESFRLELVDNQQIHKAVLRIDGRVFERVSTQKRKARDGVVIDALEYLFSDIVNDLRNRYYEAFEQQNIMTLSRMADSLTNATPPAPKASKPLAKQPSKPPAKQPAKQPAKKAAEQPASKKKEVPPPPLPSSVDRPPVKKELKPAVVERLVKLALGLIKSENPNTVTALFSLFEKDVFEFEVKQLSQIEPKFEATLRVGDRWYSDTAVSIKKVKSQVTKKALRDLFPEYAGPEDVDTCEETKSDSSPCNGMTVNGTNGTMDDGNGVLEASAAEASAAEKAERLCFSDFVANLVESKYHEVVQDQPEHLRRYSVLAGIVMMQNNDTSTASVISVSTGNKCLRGDNVTTNGDVLFDCHAEILSKRCLISYIYSQLHIAITTDQETILESGDRGLLRIKDSVKFYLFISSAPCGDGRIFSFAPAKNPDRKKLAVKRGMLRVKLESGMGGIPVTEYSDSSTTYEGYLKGKPLVIMCCSAKLLRANLLGVQGALLSQIIEPVFFAGVLIGDIFRKDNMSRALYGRLTMSDDEVPPPYRINRPFVEGISNSKIATNVKPGKACMNWVASEPVVEFINMKTGKTGSEQVSRLCKLSLFRRYLQISTLLKKMDAAVVPHLVYRSCKEHCQAYQQVKKMLFDDLENSCRGKWLVKPRELNDFCVAGLEE